MPSSDPPPWSGVRSARPVGRLAPSPTGAQHLGNARTYLLAWLSARAAGGGVVLRIEDIDSPRVKDWAVDQAIEDLRWLGLDWDQGPDIGGPYGPYVQTERSEVYRQVLQQLIDSSKAYPCTCTRKDIELAASAPHESSSVAGSDSTNWLTSGDGGTIYPGTCSGWQPGDPLPAAGSYCWRFRVPDAELEMVDGLLGPLRMNPRRQLGDFPLTRKSGEAAYQLAVVIDDASMGINQVVRGDDLVPSAFRQRALFNAMGLDAPRYIHVPLVVGPDGRRLAKRHGDTRLSQYRQRGVSAARIIGWAAHSVGLVETPEPITPQALLGDFQWRRVRRDPTIVSAESLFD